MTRDRSPERSPKVREKHSPGDRRQAVERAGGEASWTQERWREQDAPHRPGKYLWVSGAYARTMSELNDAGFLITMRNRLKSLEFERTGPMLWQRIKRFLLIVPRTTPVAGFEIRRLKQIAGEAPPDALRDHRTYNMSYDLFLSMVTAAERVAAADAQTAIKTDSAN